jgi:rhodanese-related sulfurtransferase
MSMLRNNFARTVVLVAIGLVIAIVANGFAGRTRRLALPGYYPNALVVPPKVAERVLPTRRAPLPAATATIAQSPAPGQPPIAIPTDTIARPAGAITTTTAAPPATTTTTTSAAAPAPAQPAVPAPAQPAADALARFTPHPDKAYVEIGGDDAALLYSKGSLFLDARRTSIFEAGHIAGARSFSVWEADVDDKVNALYEERNDPAEQNKPIVIYCSGGACEDSHMLAQKLWGIQFNNVYVYKDGFPDWQQRNLPVRTGGQP